MVSPRDAAVGGGSLARARYDDIVRKGVAMTYLSTDDRIQHVIAHSDGVSRAQLAATFALPRPPVTARVRRLLAGGTVVEKEVEGPRSVSGRRPHLLFLAGRRPVLGV